MTGTTRCVQADGAVLVFASPCGNIPATRAVLAEAGRRGIPPDRILCIGGLAGHDSDLTPPLQLVRASAIHVVAPDHDRRLAIGQVEPDTAAWLSTQPSAIELHIAGLTFLVVHATGDGASRTVFASTPALAKKRQLERAGFDGIVAGAGGLPFTQSIDGRLWHNPGSAEMPANDGTQRVWCSIITPGDGEIEIAHVAITYDYETADSSSRDARRAAALRSGIWPSFDALPQKEIHATGIPLEPAALVWKPDPKERSRRRGAPICERTLWPSGQRDNRKPLAPEKFRHPGVTAKGEQRARVPLRSLDTLWFNTGTLCNITCRNCYIESSPKNDRLVYLTLDDVRGYLDEIARDGLPTKEIGFTGGEPFLNPDFLDMLEECLARGFHTLTLTNAMRPMQRHKKALLALKERYGKRLSFRVSLDHFNPERHEDERGIDTFEPAMTGLSWISHNGFEIAVAGRSMWGETPEASRSGFAALL
jgi:hypothetical protein